MTNGIDEQEGVTEPETPVVKESNEDRKRKRLRREATRAHEWRVQVWAQMELKIQGANAEAAVLGADPYEPFDPDFSTPEMLKHYAEMQLTK
jgi:hypothetical protein